MAKCPRKGAACRERGLRTQASLDTTHSRGPSSCPNQLLAVVPSPPLWVLPMNKARAGYGPCPPEGRYGDRRSTARTCREGTGAGKRGAYGLEVVTPGGQDTGWDAGPHLPAHTAVCAHADPQTHGPWLRCHNLPATVAARGAGAAEVKEGNAASGAEQG